MGPALLIHREIAGNVEEFFSINEWVRALVVKVNKRYRLKIIQAYASTASYEDETVDRFYEDVESAINKGTAQFTIVMRDFYANVGANRTGEISVGNFGIGTSNISLLFPTGSKHPHPPQ